MLNLGTANPQWTGNQRVINGSSIAVQSRIDLANLSALLKLLSVTVEISLFKHDETAMAIASFEILDLKFIGCDIGTMERDAHRRW